MNIIKLDAIASTNTYLKEMLSTFQLENFTVVTAENQFAGRGQRGTEFVIEPGSNLTFSVLLKDLLPSPESVFDLNIMVGLSVLNALKKKYNLPFSIKWANDILAGTKKICGILIENVIKSSGEILSVVGIGINVNQEKFDGLPQASSLANLLDTKLDKEEILNDVLIELHTNCEKIKRGETENLWEEYHQNLFRINQACVFELPAGNRFQGMIQGVTRQGKLVVAKQDDEIEEFEIKTIKMLY